MAKRKKKAKHCNYCGRKTKKSPINRRALGSLDPDERTIDHVIPLSKGGRNIESNRVIACHECNNKKGSQEWFPRYDNDGRPRHGFPLGQ